MCCRVQIFFGPDLLLTDIGILAVHASQVAAAQKDRPGTIRTTKRGLFTMMIAIGTYIGQTAAFTIAHFPGKAVHVALPGTNIAIGKAFPQD